MAFDDFPMVDENSKASEKSVLAIKGFFAKASGFISREPNPDMGIDLEVELILDDKNASGSQFPIQIKSDQKVAIVVHEGKQYISYPFKTSRLGYLCRRAPHYGLVIIYDDQNGIGYFDYVELIVERLMDQKNNADWKMQESVNINIPIDSILFKSQVQSIHSKFRLRYENHCLMIAKYGNAYAIPYFFPEEIKDQYKLDSQEEVIDFISKYGFVLFNQKEFLFIDSLLNKISFQQISQSLKLLFIAATTYGSVGKYIEAEYFVNKALSRKSELLDDEICILEATKAQIDYVFGNIAAKEYLSKLEKLLLNVDTDAPIQINLKLRILHLKLALYKPHEKEFAEIFDEILNVLSLIEKCSLSEDLQYHYKVNLGTELFLMMVFSFSDAVGTFRIREHVFSVSIQEKLVVAKYLMNLHRATVALLKEATDYATQKDNKFLIACILYSRGFSLFMFNLHSTMWNNTQFLDETESRNMFDWVMHAHGYFLRNGFVDHAYKALTIAYDINKLHTHLFKKALSDVDVEKLTNDIRNFEKSMGLSQFVSLVDNFLNDKKAIEQIDPVKEIMRMSDQEIETYASDMLRCLALPQERLTNLINDLKFQRNAYQVLEGTRFEVFQNLLHTKSNAALYKEPIEHILICKTCGFQTVPGNDLDQLLHYKKTHHPHVCL